MDMCLIPVLKCMLEHDYTSIYIYRTANYLVKT